MEESPSVNFPPVAGAADKSAEFFFDNSEVVTLPKTPDLMLALLAKLVASGLLAVVEEEIPEPDEKSREPVPRAAPGPSC